MLPLFFSLAFSQETCSTNNDACNYIEYRNTACKTYKTAVAQNAAEADLLNIAESELLNTELADLLSNNKYYRGVEFVLSSIDPNNPDDIVTEFISKTNDDGFYFEYILKTTEALMDICGTVKVTFTERFREPIKTETEWQALIEDELLALVAVESSNARIRLYDPNAGKFILVNKQILVMLTRRWQSQPLGQDSFVLSSCSC